MVFILAVFFCYKPDVYRWRFCNINLLLLWHGAISCFMVPMVLGKAVIVLRTVIYRLLHLTDSPANRHIVTCSDSLDSWHLSIKQTQQWSSDQKISYGELHLTLLASALRIIIFPVFHDAGSTADAMANQSGMFPDDRGRLSPRRICDLQLDE